MTIPQGVIQFPNDDSYQKHLDQFRIGPIIEHGKYGRVHELGNVVIKMQSPRKKESEGYGLVVDTEFEIHRRLFNEFAPHIPLVYHQFYVRFRRYAMVMQNVGPNLQNLRPISLDAIESYAKKMLEILAFMHQSNIGHFDLNPNNCTRDTLFDFGFSELVPPDGIHDIKNIRQYRAPENILQLPTDMKADLWSLGCILFELWTGNPFIHLAYPSEYNLDAEINTIDLILDRLRMNQIPERMWQATPIKIKYEERVAEKEPIPYISAFDYDLAHSRYENPIRFKQFLDLVTQLLKFDPQERISAADALKHSFFTSEHSTDISFKLTLSGDRKFAIEIYNGLSPILKRIDLTKWEPSDCFHIPKLRKYHIWLTDLSSRVQKIFLEKIPDRGTLHLDTEKLTLKITCPKA